MKLFNAQSKKTENAVTVLEDKVLGFETLNLISGGIMIGPKPKLPNSSESTVKTASENP